MAHTIINPMNVRQNTVTLQTAGTYADQDISINNIVDLGSFTNAPVENQTYTEDESTNTVIPSGGYLYINKGWYDNVKISLGHLIPEIASNDAGVNEILNGYKAYDENGNIITGTMATVDPTFTGGGVTATAGGSVTTAPKVIVTQSISNAASTTYGFTATSPGGTEGTNYLKIDASGTPTEGSVTATANASSAAVVFAQAVKGFLDKAANVQALAGQTATQDTATITVTPTVTDNAAPVYVPIVTPTFDGGVITGSASVAVTQPKITLSSSASNNASTYGVTTTAPSGSYVTISAAFEATKGTATASGSATRSAVTFTNKAGAIKGNTRATALSASAATTLDGGSEDINIAVTSSSLKSHYIPIVTPTFAGGAVSGSTSVSVTNPTMTLSSSASTNSSTSAAPYGVTTTAPTSGDYVTISTAFDAAKGTATASGTASRGAVTFTNGAGAIKANTNASALTASNATLLTSDSEDINIAVTSSSLKSHYIPIVKTTIAGGVVSGSTSVSVTNPTVTVKTEMSSGASDYGVTTTQPTEGEYISIVATSSSIGGTATASGTATRGAVTMTNAAGVITAHDGEDVLDEVDVTLEGDSESIVTTLNNSNHKTHYIPKATIKAVPGAPTITKPTASASVAVADNGGSVVSGVLTSAPASGDYIKITPNVSTTAGSAKSTASAAANSAGVISADTTGGTVSGTVATVSVTNNTQATAARYIKIYDGSYTIS